MFSSVWHLDNYPIKLSHEGDVTEADSGQITSLQFKPVLVVDHVMTECPRLFTEPEIESFEHSSNRAF